LPENAKKGISKLKGFVRKNPTLLRVTKELYEKLAIARVKSTKIVLPQHTEIITIRDAVSLTLQWTETLPNDFDAIIGVPRSGLLFANVLASKLGLPLSTPDNYVQGIAWQSNHVKIATSKFNKVLIVEDSVFSGRQIAKAEKKIKAFNPTIQIQKASLFVTPKAKKKVDFYCIIKKPPNIFEWNLLTATDIFGKLCVDMDGVLCKDCPREVDSDESAYVRWLGTVKPKLIPNFEIEAIITSRLEKYRGQTEEWLRLYGVKYKRLFMLNLNSKSDKTFAGVVDYKAGLIKKIRPFWFWESSLNEAIAIHKQVQIPILCTERMVIFT
jgi:hypothetical protein